MGIRKNSARRLAFYIKAYLKMQFFRNPSFTDFCVHAKSIYQASIYISSVLVRQLGRSSCTSRTLRFSTRCLLGVLKLIAMSDMYASLFRHMALSISAFLRGCKKLERCRRSYCRAAKKQTTKKSLFLESPVNKPLLLGLLLVVPSLLLPLAAANVQISVIQSNDNSYFKQTNQSLSRELGDAFQVTVINADTVNTQHQKIQASDIIITLGIDAALEIARRYDTKNIVSAYLTLNQKQRHQAKLKHHSLVLLDQPLSRYLAFTALMLQPSSVGIVSSDKLMLNNKQQDILAKFHFKLEQYEFQKQTNLLTTVRQLLKNNNAFLLLPDDNIYNSNTLKGILLTSYRSRKPIVSYSPSHVKAGALASIFSSPSDIGLQLASVIKHLIVKRQQTKPIIQFAQYFSIKVNSRVARALGINLPNEEKIIDRLNELSQ
jgi:putative ABC transport system substrate-binding protein